MSVKPMNEELFEREILRCPACGRPLVEPGCAGCGLEIPMILGIPDLRWPRPEREDPAETALLARMAAAFADMSFDELVRLRFAETGTSPEFLKIYFDYYHGLEERGRRMLDMFEARLDQFFPHEAAETALDVGCGIGASSVVLAGRFERVIGIEPSMATLILARKFLEERGLDNIWLIQAYGQTLPLREECVDLAVAQNVIEHLIDVEPALREINRVLRAGGRFCGDSRNRFDPIFPEPHTNLRWVGFFPVRWQAGYVRRFKQMSYQGTRLLSLAELAGSARRAFAGASRVVFPLPSAYGQGDIWDRLLELVEKIPLVRTLLLAIYPSHLLLARKKKRSGA